KRIKPQKSSYAFSTSAHFEVCIRCCKCLIAIIVEANAVVSDDDLNFFRLLCINNVHRDAALLDSSSAKLVFNGVHCVANCLKDGLQSFSRFCRLGQPPNTIDNV